MDALPNRPPVPGGDCEQGEETSWPHELPDPPRLPRRVRLLLEAALPVYCPRQRCPSTASVPVPTTGPCPFPGVCGYLGGRNRGFCRRPVSLGSKVAESEPHLCHL